MYFLDKAILLPPSVTLSATTSSFLPCLSNPSHLLNTQNPIIPFSTHLSAMGSNVLPQALCMVPRNHPGFSPGKKLGFSALINRSPSSFNSSALSVSRVLPNSFSSSFGKSYENRNFVVRAEEVAENAESAAEAPEEEPEAVEEPEQPPRKPIVKLGDIMGILHKRAIEASDEVRATPDIRVGDVVEIKLEVPENRRRLSVYKGIVMSRQNAGIHTTIRIRRIIAGIGVEIVFPLYSPNIKEIRVLSHRKVRRARLYYLRDKLPRLSTFK